jgi:uncharacterized membrane protein YidH (DUF202 family)
VTARPDDDPGVTAERTALAWTRSALNLAANGALIARAAFVAGLPVVGVVVAVLIAIATMLVWRHGQLITLARRRSMAGPQHQSGPLRLLSVVAIATAAAATAVSVID